MTDDEMMEMLAEVVENNFSTEEKEELGEILEQMRNRPEDQDADWSNEGVPIPTVLLLLSMPEKGRKGNLIIMMIMDFYNTYGKEDTERLLDHIRESFDRAMDQLEEDDDGA